MSHIIAGDPAPTNPTRPGSARARLERCCGQPTPPELIADLDAFRAEVLAEAIEAARSEYLTDNTGTDEDNAYNNGITDAVAAIGSLTEGASR